MISERARRKGLAILERDIARIREENKTLAGFVRNAWHILEPIAEYVHNWHVDAICAHLEAVTRGEITRLIINVPPGTMKSLLVSVFWPAWEWANGHAGMRYLCSSYSLDFTVRDAQRMKDLVQSEWYRRLYPEIVLRQSGTKVFTNTMTGKRDSRPFPSLTGGRGDRVIIDDPHSTETAESEAERETTARITRESLPSRVNHPTKSAIVIIMQRLHTKDVTGLLLTLEQDYTVLVLPMEFEAAKKPGIKFVPGTDNGGPCETPVPWTYKGKRYPTFRDPRTREGELLDPQRFSREAVDKLKRALGSYAVAGQLQQRPTARGGIMFQRHWFPIVRAIPVGARRIVRIYDLAATVPAPGRDPDWSCGLRASRHADGTFYLEAMLRMQASALTVETAIKNTASQDGPSVLIRIPKDPAQAGKDQAERYVKLLAGYMVKAEPATGSKVTRATAASAQAEAGNIKIVATGDPAKDAWIEPFLDEVTAFPRGAHDDQVDVLSDAINELTLGSTYTLANL